MNGRRVTLAVVFAIVAFAGTTAWWLSRDTSGLRPLRVGISPYQDIAMLVNAENLKLEAKYGTRLELRTMAWEDILPAVASSSATSIDVGFGSLTEFLTKFDKLNAGSTDPVVFVYPLYVYKGGGFVSFNPAIEPLAAAGANDPQALKAFLSAEFAAQKQSVYEMVLFSLARRAGINPVALMIRDLPLNDALLAASGGSIDVAAAGLTQLTEAVRRGGRVVLKMDDAGFADITGFICRRSVLASREADVKNLVRMWFESVSYVAADPEKNSIASLEYLRKNSATRYSFDEYKAALDQEYLPRSVQEAREQLMSANGRYPLDRISADVSGYLAQQGLARNPPPTPIPVDVR